jgi:hypothetical protein
VGPRSLGGAVCLGPGGLARARGAADVGGVGLPDRSVRRGDALVCARSLGLSLTPVRIEGGPKIRGGSEDDPSPDVHNSPGSQYYFQAGTRAGIAFNAGIVDILVEAPTLAWRSHPFSAGEIVTFGLGIRLN